ncbi:FRG domain-containing protein [Leifsonia sp. NPDC058230]|uniref:FRG domain-containing protein n=1 Tax=Leifsonia sp. NPDC058230 TaxID=3346391 RepID=UPI0036DC8989
MPHAVGMQWRNTGWWVEPSDARQVMSLIGCIGAYSARARFAWRGLSSADYALLSSLHRWVGPTATESMMRAAEVELIAAAREWGLGRGPMGHVDDLQLLADLQHYGIRTRLIDFSSNPMTALWFACQTPSRVGVAKSGVLLAVNRSGWSEYATVASPAALTRGDVDDPTGNRLKQALSEQRCFVVNSSTPNDRLRAQEGFFITGPIPDEPAPPFTGLAVEYSEGDPAQLSAWLSDPRGQGNPSNIPFVAVIIRAGLKQRLRLYLEGTYNRSARILFPDFAGFREFENLARPREGVE